MKSAFIGIVCGLASAFALLMAAGDRHEPTPGSSAAHMTHNELTILVDGIQYELSEIESDWPADKMYGKVEHIKRRIVIAKMDVGD
jgi:hypothetical protein